MDEDEIDLLFEESEEEHNSSPYTISSRYSDADPDPPDGNNKASDSLPAPIISPDPFQNNGNPSTFSEPKSNPESGGKTAVSPHQERNQPNIRNGGQRENYRDNYSRTESKKPNGRSPPSSRQFVERSQSSSFQRRSSRSPPPLRDLSPRREDDTRDIRRRSPPSRPFKDPYLEPNKHRQIRAPDRMSRGRSRSRSRSRSQSPPPRLSQVSHSSPRPADPERDDARWSRSINRDKPDRDSRYYDESRDRLLSPRPQRDVYYHGDPAVDRERLAFHHNKLSISSPPPVNKHRRDDLLERDLKRGSDYLSQPVATESSRRRPVSPRGHQDTYRTGSVENIRSFPMQHNSLSPSPLPPYSSSSSSPLLPPLSSSSTTLQPFSSSSFPLQSSSTFVKDQSDRGFERQKAIGDFWKLDHFKLQNSSQVVKDDAVSSKQILTETLSTRFFAHRFPSREEAENSYHKQLWNVSQPFSLDYFSSLRLQHRVVMIALVDNDVIGAFRLISKQSITSNFRVRWEFYFSKQLPLVQEIMSGLLSSPSSRITCVSQKAGFEVLYEMKRSGSSSDMKSDSSLMLLSFSHPIDHHPLHSSPSSLSSQHSPSPVSSLRKGDRAGSISPPHLSGFTPSSRLAIGREQETDIRLSLNQDVLSSRAVYRKSESRDRLEEAEIPLLSNHSLGKKRQLSPYEDQRKRSCSPRRSQTSGRGLDDRDRIPPPLPSQSGIDRHRDGSGRGYDDEKKSRDFGRVDQRQHHRRSRSPSRDVVYSGLPDHSSGYDPQDHYHQQQKQQHHYDDYSSGRGSDKSSRSANDYFEPRDSRTYSPSPRPVSR